MTGLGLTILLLVSINFLLVVLVEVAAEMCTSAIGPVAVLFFSATAQYLTCIAIPSFEIDSALLLLALAALTIGALCGWILAFRSRLPRKELGGANR